MTSAEELKKLAEGSQVIFGSSEVLRKLKQGKLQKIFLAQNVPESVEEEINHNATIASVDVEKVSLPNDEFGIIFKRSHTLLALGVMK